MTNEEMIVAMHGVVREEINAFRGVVREEINVFRGVVREEVNAAVYASEQRTNERFDKMEQRTNERFDKLETRFNKLEGMVLPMSEHLKLLGVAQREMQADLLAIRNQLGEAMTILDLMTIKINEFETTQHNLENKVEQYLKAFERDTQRGHMTVQESLKDFHRSIQEMHLRLNTHESTHTDYTHPSRPYPAP